MRRGSGKRRQEFRGDEGLATRMRETRERLNLAQFDVSLALKVHQAQVSRWENAQSSPPPTVLRQLAKLFGVSVEWLLSGSDAQEGLTDDGVEEISGPNEGPIRGHGILTWQARAELQRRLLAAYDWLEQQKCELVPEHPATGVFILVQDDGATVVMHRITG